MKNVKKRVFYKSNKKCKKLFYIYGLNFLLKTTKIL